MKKTVFLTLLILNSFIGFAQNQGKNVLYVVDSIPIIEEPKEGFGMLTDKEIDRVEVLKNKQDIVTTGYKDVDEIIYVFTKAYAKRPDSIRAIPTTNLMVRKMGTWYPKNESTAYSGPFIDYYLNGKKQGEGTLVNGKLKGKRFIYHLNGKVSDEITYENGIANGPHKRFYEDGTLMQKGLFKDGKEKGVWEMYHPNGQLKQRSTFNENGKMDGESLSYYSTGESKGKNVYQNGIYQKNKDTDKVFELYQQGQDLFKQGNFKSAIKKYTKCLEIKPNWADGYFARGTAHLNNFDFDTALADFDKTLEIEPFFTNAYANRAFVIIRKNEFGNSRTLSKSKDVQIFAMKETEMSEPDLAKICEDLERAVSLGDKNWMVLDAAKKYCEK
ncbi:tetratricopeptide repeat protein [Flavobacteriaceae bacterium 3-367]